MKNAAYINSDKIEVFPTVNSRDNGKLLLESNMSALTYKLTTKNFIFSNHDSIEFYDLGSETNESNKTGIAFGCTTETPDTYLLLNIHGYTVKLSINSGLTSNYIIFSHSKAITDSANSYKIDENCPYVIQIDPYEKNGIDDSYSNRGNWANKLFV